MLDIVVCNGIDVVVGLWFRFTRVCGGCLVLVILVQFALVGGGTTVPLPRYTTGDVVCSGPPVGHEDVLLTTFRERTKLPRFANLCGVVDCSIPFTVGCTCICLADMGGMQLTVGCVRISLADMGEFWGAFISGPTDAPHRRVAIAAVDWDLAVVITGATCTVPERVSTTLVPFTTALGLDVDSNPPTVMAGVTPQGCGLNSIVKNT